MLTIQEMNAINELVEKANTIALETLGHPLTEREEEEIRERYTKLLDGYSEFFSKCPPSPLSSKSFSQIHYSEEIENKKMKTAILQLECDKFEEMEKVLFNKGWSKDDVENWDAVVIQKYYDTEPYLEFNGGDLNRAYQDMIHDF